MAWFAAGALVEAQNVSTGQPSMSNGTFAVDVLAPNDTWFSVESSTDLITWQRLANHPVQLVNRYRVSASVGQGETQRFFRAQSPPPLRLSPPRLSC